MIKKLIAACVAAAFFCSWCAADETLEDQLSRARDYAFSGLVKEAKLQLIPLLHEDLDAEDRAEIRFVLGATCEFLESNVACANYHWGTLLRTMPETKAAQQIRDLSFWKSLLGLQDAFNLWEDWSFEKEMRASQGLWTFRDRYRGISSENFKDIEFALEYLDRMRAKYRGTGIKEAQILYQKFLIYAGYTADAAESDEKKGHAPLDLAQRADGEHNPDVVQCARISGELRGIEGGKPLYLLTQFLLGLEEAKVTAWRGIIKLRKESVGYFENILRETRGEITNPYRIYSYLWLRDYYERKSITPPNDLFWEELVDPRPQVDQELEEAASLRHSAIGTAYAPSDD